MTQAYPLHWPEGWPRTPGHRKQPRLAGSNGPTISWDRVIRRLKEELGRLGAKGVVLSTNQPLRADGAPYAQRRVIEDMGAAVYFTLDGRQLVMAQDRYWELIDNIRSIAIAIEHMRGLERHGGGQMMSRAFAGFEALPAPGTEMKRTWRQVLDIRASDLPKGGTIEEAVLNLAEINYRRFARQHHPDNGGSHDAMAELNAAIEQARRELS